MSWGGAGEFFAMGGYGLYVWGSYGMTFALIALELVLLVLRRGGLRRNQGEQN